MRKFADLAEFVAAKGEHLGYSDWHEITQDQVTMFADATGDHQWIHVDIERARSAVPSRTASSRCPCCPCSARRSTRSAA
jgi:acyl dehydratase